MTEQHDSGQSHFTLTYYNNDEVLDHEEFTITAMPSEMYRYAEDRATSEALRRKGCNGWQVTVERVPR